MKKLILITSLTGQLIVGCPVKISNDSQTPIIVVDPHGTQALYLQPDQAKVIDPSLAPLWYYFPLKYLKKETLNVYTQENDGRYTLTYILKENFCAPDTEELSFSTIKDLVDNPTDRYTVKKLNRKESKIAHIH